ncbi:MAG: metallophosphoesterase family protein [Actinomycetota bacterium]|nr:metallophosphoesterase family protein [Actinomycetota bacterium]
MKLGIIADAHLGPPGTRVPSFHVEYESADTIVAYRLALRRCVQEDVDGVVLLGDLSHSGDDESLKAGVRLAAETGLMVWVVSGNHDCFERVDALTEAVRRVGADNVRLAAPEGEVVEEGLRVAGISVTSGHWGYTADDRPDVSKWEDDPVVWLTHYPMISFAEKVSEAGLVYGDDLEDLEETTRPLLARSAPAIVVNGHIHVRYACVMGEVLQVSCGALIEPPFEVTFLDLYEPESGRISVRAASVPLVSSLPVHVPTLSSPRQEWVFEAGAWRSVETAKPT